MPQWHSHSWLCSDPVMLTTARAIWLRRKKWLIVAGGLAIALTALLGARLTSPATKIPMAEARLGPFEDYLQLRGELKAHRSIVLTGPIRAGQLQIIQLASDGATVKKGDVVVKFDGSKLEQQLAEDQAALKTAEAQIQQSQAQARLTEEQDLTDLMKARYTLQSAKLDASKMEILSKIDGEKARLAVSDAELAVKEAEQKLKMDRAAAAADLVDQKQKRDKALFDVHRGETALASMTLKAPIDGSVTILTYWTPNGPRPFRPGDQPWSGAGIAELPDLSSLFFDTRADETDRSRLKPQQTVVLRADAMPGQELRGHIAEISMLASLDFSAPWPFPRNFDVQVQLDGGAGRLRPGMSATARIAVNAVPNAILIPVAAAFQKAGGTVAYVWRGGKFEERPIQIAQRGEGIVTVANGLKPGDRVALQNPTVKE